MHRIGGSLGLTLTLALVSGLLSTGCNDATEGKEFFQADLNGGNEVPPRDTAATGVCGFAVTGDRVDFSITTRGLSSGVVGAHIHLAPAGSNGPVRVPFINPNLAGTNIQTPFVAPDGGILMENSFGGSDVTGGLTLADVLSAMRSGGAYCNIHTANFPGGEIRGQIRAVSVD
jgi:CHRD domain-containing protein